MRFLTLFIIFRCDYKTKRPSISKIWRFSKHIKKNTTATIRSVPQHSPGTPREVYSPQLKITSKFGVFHKSMD